ncbi:T-lymphocyte surface antigen Ly-9-like [Sander lucioperca]|uniref:T-lymphocyte surface antigen Ly-9-like n=1 Tax=Sander lucioperca TaxID=283035 RepID=UPI00165366AE|nr:T-lymphocyte surface antigen Ly-9-like [Sander lucioperca]
MEKLTWCWLLLAVLNSALAQNKLTTKYFTDGGELTLDLRPPPPPGPLGDVLWKIDGNLVAEWVKDIVPVTYYRNFIGRTTLNVTTGRLVIKDMTKADMGVYSVEVNRKVQNERYNAVWIKEVPQPEIWIRPLTCSNDSDSCTLDCEANITEPAGPVTYSWKKGDGEWKESGKDLDITKNGTLDVETFTCRIQNPVSERDSKPKRNPLLEEKRG